MTPLQEKILNLKPFYCKFEYDPKNKCTKVQCPECKALEEILKQEFLDE